MTVSKQIQWKQIPRSAEEKQRNNGSKYAKETEKKYRILSEARRKGHPITFDVLYDAKGKRYAAIKEEIGRKEGELIR